MSEDRIQKLGGCGIGLSSPSLAAAAAAAMIQQERPKMELVRRGVV